MSGVHDSIWRSCEAARMQLDERRRLHYESIDPPPEPEMVEPNLEDLTDDAVDIAVALGVKRGAAERLVLLAYREEPEGTVEDWAAWICRNQNRR